MSDSESIQPAEGFAKVDSIFIRHRNVLAIRGKFSEIYTDYYIHLMENKLKYEGSLDLMLKQSLAVLTLHLVSRPWRETIAWTANLRAPRVNLFVTGGSVNEFITGRVFTKDIREPDRNFLYSQTLAKGTEPHTSTVEVEGTNPMKWVEHYYEKSEQRPCKCYELPNEEFIMFAAQPGFDEEWFSSLDKDVAASFEKTEQTKLLESRKFRFFCGCNTSLILPALAAYKDDPEKLFQGDPSITAQCPRCGASHVITKEDLLNL